MFSSIIFYFFASYLIVKSFLQNFKLIDKWELDKSLEWKWKSMFFSISMVRKSSIKRCCYESVNTGGFVVAYVFWEKSCWIISKKNIPLPLQRCSVQRVFEIRTQKTKDFETNNVTTYPKLYFFQSFGAFLELCWCVRQQKAWKRVKLQYYSKLDKE